MQAEVPGPPLPPWTGAPPWVRVEAAALAAAATADAQPSARLAAWLLGRALEAREQAYAPYSRFRVGAVLLSASGRAWTGCNVENSSYGATVCAERTALGAAVGAGDRGPFPLVAVVSDALHRPGGGFITPCGICRQRLSEFGVRGVRLLLGRGGLSVASGAEDHVCVTLGELLPRSFGPADLLDDAEAEVAAAPAPSSPP